MGIGRCCKESLGQAGDDGVVAVGYQDNARLGRDCLSDDPVRMDDLAGKRPT